MSQELVVTLAFIIFIALLFKRIKDGISKFLDGKIEKSLNLINNAESIRLQAEESLRDAQLQLLRAQQTAQDIILQAQIRVDNILKEAHDQITTSTQRKTQEILKNIKKQKSQIINELKNQVIQSIIKDVKDKLTNELSREAQLKLIDRNIEKIKEISH